jgi:hypothetical protein
VINLDKLKCPACGTELTLETGYTGCDWNCKAGMDSGFGYQIDLVCKGCGRVYTLGHTKNIGDFSEPIDKYRCFK